jgi:hypothetical protein
LVKINDEMKNSFLQDLGISLPLLLAGFFGALLLVKKEGKTWKDNLLTLVTGSFSATYLAPFLIEMLNIQSKNAETFFGFAVGFGSIQILEFIMNKYFKKEQKDEQ